MEMSQNCGLRNTSNVVQDEYFNMDDRKWDEMVKEATEKGYRKDTKECEEILEDMLNWDKLLPEFTTVIASKYQHKEFEDDVAPPQDSKKDIDDPPGEGPILTWQTRGVFAPGGTNAEKKTDPLNIIKEAAKARQLMDDARTSYLKDKLKADPLFMGILQAKMAKSQGSKLYRCMRSRITAGFCRISLKVKGKYSLFVLVDCNFYEIVSTVL
ncbi:hypothetical protein ACFE04_021740 [Oxalis oulophora]